MWLYVSVCSSHPGIPTSQCIWRKQGDKDRLQVNEAEGWVMRDTDSLLFRRESLKPSPTLPPPFQWTASGRRIKSLNPEPSTKPQSDSMVPEKPDETVGESRCPQIWALSCYEVALPVSPGSRVSLSMGLNGTRGRLSS